MKYNILGNTDMKVSHVSMGGASFSNIYGSFDEEKSLQLIKKTLSLGVNYLETGPWYGQGSSEKVIGKMHDITFAPDISIILKETLPALDRAVKDGKARYIGVADYDLDLMKEIIEESDIHLSTILSYSKSTLFDNRLQNYAKYFKVKGVGIINAAATGMGLLTNHGPQPWHPASDDIKALCQRASNYCKDQGVELARLATWFTLNQPDVDTNVCGFFNIEQMEDTLNVSEKGLTEHEKAVLAHLQLRFFDNITLHWDEVELNAYKTKLENITT
ncbi:uncharacterized protein LOC134804852 isoform X2 [Cydia splendana]|uniref:uncharacterized protein LOC134804852 isoform X2 n=1 Tax=Cydia splendana TaxID=1100963 RepID=UPI00300CBB8C